MTNYITLRCVDCNYEKAYSERLADGHRCPKCGSGLYVPIVQSRPMTTGELASAIAQWCKREGYSSYSVGTNQISETEIIVETNISK